MAQDGHEGFKGSVGLVVSKCKAVKRGIGIMIIWDAWDSFIDMNWYDKHCTIEIKIHRWYRPQNTMIPCDNVNPLHSTMASTIFNNNPQWTSFISTQNMIDFSIRYQKLETEFFWVFVLKVSSLRLWLADQILTFCCYRKLPVCWDHWLFTILC